MRALVLGGYGAVGVPVVAALRGEGYEAVTAGRDRTRADRAVDLREPGLGGYRDALDGVDVVVNAAGVEDPTVVALAAAAGVAFVNITATTGYVAALERLEMPAPVLLSVGLAGAIGVVVGGLTAVSAVALLALFGTSSTLTSGTHTLTTPTAALLADAGPLTNTSAVAGVIGTPTVRVSATAGTGPVFVGIGPAADVDRYLAGVATDEVTGLNDRSVQLTVSRHPGSATPAPPAQQSFWVASATGPSLAELTWRVQDGRYRIVVMNLDGTTGVATQAQAGLELPNVFAISLGVLFGGLLVTGAGIAVLVAVNRRRPTTV